MSAVDDVTVYDDTIRIGLTWVLEGDAPLDDDGNSVSLSGATIYCLVKDQPGGTTLLTCTGSAPTAATWRVVGARADTAAMVPGGAVGDVLVKYADNTADILCSLRLRIEPTVSVIS